MTVLEMVEFGLVILGGGLVALAGLGLFRLPDALTRASAVSKAAALGVALIVVAAMIEDRSIRTYLVLGLVLLAHVVTVPLSGLALGKAAYRSGSAKPPVTRFDEPAEHRDISS